MAKIKDVKARQILDSRGFPTVECDVMLEDGSIGRSSVPSGASTGSHEAWELRDDDSSMYHGKSVLKAVYNINEEIRDLIIGMDASNQESIDSFMIRLDGTQNKSRLGANAILAVSMAVARAQANSEKLELFQYIARFSAVQNNDSALPYPMVNIMNGGKHAFKASDFQEYMIIPTARTSFKDRIRVACEVFHTLKKILMEDGYQVLVGDEGGFAPSLGSNTKPLDYIVMAIERSGYRPGKDVLLALDVASSGLHKGNSYLLESEGRDLTTVELVKYYDEIIRNYPIGSIEDPFYEDDFDAWARFTKTYGDKMQIVGDDLYVTNINRLKKGIEMGSSNAILIKLNQIGTVSETISTINLARSKGFGCIISHRSGETEDTFIADLCVGMSTGQIKTGSVSRTERVAKYNRLIRIEEILSSSF